MSKTTLAILVPIWIGIVFNLALVGFNLSRIGKPPSTFTRWYIDRKGGMWLMGIVWALLLSWSLSNWLHGST